MYPSTSDESKYKTILLHVSTATVYAATAFTDSTININVHHTSSSISIAAANGIPRTMSPHPARPPHQNVLGSTNMWKIGWLSF